MSVLFINNVRLACVIQQVYLVFHTSDTELWDKITPLSGLRYLVYYALLEHPSKLGNELCACVNIRMRKTARGDKQN